jgi:hypothetical protein
MGKSLAPIAQPRTAAMMSDDFLQFVRTFNLFGTPTISKTAEGIPYLINEFWTARQRQAHSIHEVSYRACFKPQIPEFFVGRLTVAGEGVLDPFMGRGTTPIQAALMGRRPLGNDINPLSTLLTRPRLAPPTVRAIRPPYDGYARYEIGSFMWPLSRTHSRTR